MAVSERHGDGVLRHDGLPRGRVRRDHHALPLLHDLHGLLLEGVQAERVHLCGILVVVPASLRVRCPSGRADDVVEASVRGGVCRGDAGSTRGEDGLDIVLRRIHVDRRPGLEQRLHLCRLFVEERGTVRLIHGCVAVRLGPFGVREEGIVIRRVGHELASLRARHPGGTHALARHRKWRSADKHHLCPQPPLRKSHF